MFRIAAREAWRRLTQFYDDALEPWGLRSTQYAMLNELARSARPPTLAELASEGYAAFLAACLVRKLRAEGATRFLHVFPDNISTIALYERLGFTNRKTLRLTVLARHSNG